MPISCLSGIFLESAGPDGKENWCDGIVLSPGICQWPSETAHRPGALCTAKPSTLSPNTQNARPKEGAPVSRFIKIFHLLQIKNFSYQTCRCEKVWGYSCRLHLGWDGLPFSQLPGMKWFWRKKTPVQCGFHRMQSATFQKCNFLCCSSGLLSPLVTSLFFVALVDTKQGTQPALSLSFLIREVGQQQGLPLRCFVRIKRKNSRKALSRILAP